MLLLLELRLIRHCVPTFVVAPPFCIGASQPNSTAASPSLRPTSCRPTASRAGVECNSAGSRLPRPATPKEGLKASALRVVEYGGRRAAFDDPPLIHERHVMGNLMREAHLVRDDDHRHAFLGELPYHREHL